MFGLIGHSTSFEDAKRKASLLGFDHIADGDLDVWCTAPPQLVENVEVRVLLEYQLKVLTLILALFLKCFLGLKPPEEKC